MVLNLQIGVSFDSTTGRGDQVNATHECLIPYIKLGSKSRPLVEELNLRVTIQEMDAHCSRVLVEFGGDPLVFYGVWCAKKEHTIISRDMEGEVPMDPYTFFKAIFTAREAACADA